MQPFKAGRESERALRNQDQIRQGICPRESDETDLQLAVREIRTVDWKSSSSKRSIRISHYISLSHPDSPCYFYSSETHEGTFDDCYRCAFLFRTAPRFEALKLLRRVGSN